MNILLIDSKISNYELFNSSANQNTTPLVYSSTTSTTEDILSAIRQSISSQNQTTIARIGLVFEIKEPRRPTLFLGNAPFFSATDTVEPFSANVAFLINLITEFQVPNIDFLACNSLNVPVWVNYYALLTASTGVIVGASDNETGNIKYGGDWVMESTSQDIELLYFTSSIENYASLLAGGAATISSSIVIKNDGNIYGTGYNLDGELGLGDNINYNTLQLMTSKPADKTPKYISGGNTCVIVLMTDGTVWGTGDNSSGQLGLGGGSDLSYNTLQPMLMPPSRLAKYISCADSSTIVLMRDGTVWGTGYNVDGELGLGDNTNRDTLQLMTSVPAGVVKYISNDYYATYLVMADGTAYGTGDNGNGQLCLGAGADLIYNTFQPMLMPPGKFASYIANKAFYINNYSYNTTLVLMTDGTVYQNDSNGVLEPLPSLAPLLDAGKIVKNIAGGFVHSLVLMTDGTVYGIGQNDVGQLGLGNGADLSYNTLQLMDMSGVGGRLAKSISAGDQTLVLMTDNTVYGTGLNTYGELGLGNFDFSYNTLQPMLNGDNVIGAFSLMDIVDDPVIVPCFKADTKILTANGYKPIKELRKGDMIKTLRDGYKPLVLLGKRDIYHDAHAKADSNNKNITSEENKNRLYRCSMQNFPDLFEELVITGAHAILVDDLTDLQRENTIKVLSKIYITDNKYRLPACVDERATIYEKNGTYTIYHLALEHENYYMNYGIYANGLLVETCSQRYLKELSNMTLL